MRSYLAGCWTSLIKCRFFLEIRIHQLQPKKETSHSTLRDRLEKSFIISPFKLSHLSPAILQCRAFEIGNSASVTIDTYTAGAWKGAGQNMVFDLFVLNSVRVCPQQPINGLKTGRRAFCPKPRAVVLLSSEPREASEKSNYACRSPLARALISRTPARILPCLKRLLTV